MANKQISALNTISGRVGRVPVGYLKDPQFGEYLVEVPEGTKDFDPIFWKPTDTKSHRAKETTQHKQERAAAEKEKEEATETPQNEKSGKLV